MTDLDLLAHELEVANNDVSEAANQLAMNFNSPVSKGYRLTADQAGAINSVVELVKLWRKASQKFLRAQVASVPPLTSSVSEVRLVKRASTLVMRILAFGERLNKESNWSPNHARELAEIKAEVEERVETIDEAALAEFLRSRATCTSGPEVTAREVISFIKGDLR